MRVAHLHVQIDEVFSVRHCVCCSLFYTSDIELAHWIAKIKEPIWKMLAALTVDIVTFTTVWSMSTILQYSILNLNQNLNNFKLQQKLKNFKYDNFIISVF